jgi:teichoic acid transport system permease protein
LENIFVFARALKTSSSVFWELCNLDLKQRTVGSLFGFFWMYFSPLLSIAIIWFVFHFGLKGNSTPGSVYYLLVGLMAWQLISDTVFSGISTFTEKPYLIKKIKFPLELLPVIKVVNAFRIHIPFLILIFITSIVSGKFHFENIVIFPIFICLIFIFLTGLILLLSTVIVFYKDLQNAVGLIMQLFFWGTPIIWNLNVTPKYFEYIELFNPFNFIISSYRYCFLDESQNSLLGLSFFS